MYDRTCQCVTVCLVNADLFANNIFRNRAHLSIEKIHVLDTHPSR